MADLFNRATNVKFVIGDSAKPLLDDLQFREDLIAHFAQCMDPDDERKLVLVSRPDLYTDFDGENMIDAQVEPQVSSPLFFSVLPDFVSTFIS